MYTILIGTSCRTLYSGTYLMYTQLVPSIMFCVKRCPYFGGLGIFAVSTAMHTCAIEHFADTFQSSPLLYTGEKG